MAQKRMFDKRVVESDKFIDLPNSAKALYFMAGMDADDKGFFQPRRLQKLCGFTDDDYKILLAKRFFISFETGVMVITEWNKNNYLDKNRITETEYIEELNMLKLVNEKYEISSCLTNVKQMFNQNSIEENSIEENSIEENSIEENKKEKEKRIDLQKIYFEDLQLNTTFIDWLDYKKEQHKFTYKPKSLETLIKQIATKKEQYGKEYVIDSINNSIANGWKGIIYKQPEKNKTGWEDFFRKE